MYQANILGYEEDPRSDEYYQKAVDYFKKCYELNAESLPEHFIELIYELEEE